MILSLQVGARVWQVEVSTDTVDDGEVSEVSSDIGFRGRVKECDGGGDD